MPNELSLSPQRASALAVMANRANVEPDKLLATLKATVFKGASNEELLALVVVANQYGLNPFLRELFAFPNGKGGIVPMVPIDGWTKIVNRAEEFDGVEFSFEEGEDKKPISCTAKMYSKSRSHPISVTEYYVECHRNTPPWNTMPRRMLRHKAYIQAARVAYGISGIFDEDEAKDAARNGAAPQASADIQFGPALPEGDAIDLTPEPEKPKRHRRTKEEIEAEKKAVVAPTTPPNDESPFSPPPPPKDLEPEPPLHRLLNLLLAEEIDQAKFQRFLITEGYIEPSDTLDKLDDAKLSEIIVSLPSIKEDMAK